MLRCPFAAANSHISKQGFPQVLRTWGGALQNLMGEGLSQYMRGAGGA